ncbi:MAG: serine hydrolase domain-containing protein [Caldilineaceae bacterium]
MTTCHRFRLCPRCCAPVTPGTVQLSSISKTFTATAILQLVEQGKVDLDAPVTKYLPYFALADGRQDEIIAKVSGQSYEAYITEHIFAPLGMPHSTLLLADVDPKALAMPHVPGDDGQVAASDIFPYTRSFAPDSTLYSNVEDMAAYEIATLRHGAAGQPAILTPDSYDAAWTIYSQAPFPPPDTAYGFGWQIGEHAGEQVVGHSGIDIGHNSFPAMLPAHSAAAIVMTNINDLEEFVMPAFLMRDGLLDIVLQAFTQK